MITAYGAAALATTAALSAARTTQHFHEYFEQLLLIHSPWLANLLSATHPLHACARHAPNATNSHTHIRTPTLTIRKLSISGADNPFSGFLWEMVPGAGFF
ncbi:MULTISPECIES: hypothetical protein [unclassified Pseudomonas]|uniref:hypothetical protein n=1 Tax=unclassified Pseudomonas TaxID=196821 RepID=UPI0011EBC6E3|nr:MULTISPECIES: hypothetical protein [unclassified Pseudomonas]KAA0946830.1 hypothetical protein FQ182_10765 [Pseudomonas sp. ANT_H4]KAA0952747.1 hypothetical protein FQ186_10420 [Pseudomonas sp. ANT_H14]